MKLFLGAFLALSAAAPLSAQTHASASDLRAINAVIETFRTAIINKDKAALEKLPASPNISFMSSATPETLAYVRTRRPEAKRLTPDSYSGFVEFISTTKDKVEETFDNISVQSDGSVASVYFTYQFKENDKLSNFGTETWGLIATDDGWKISSVIYSIAVPEAQMPH